MNFVQSTQSALTSLALGAIATLFPLEAVAAERITFNIAPFGQFYLQVDDLETFVATGEISSELAYYFNRLPPQQVARLPELLSTPLEVDPLSIAKFSNSTIGEAVIRNFGKVIRSKPELNGFFALRGAIIAAAFDRQGLTIMNLLHQFPLEHIYVDLKVINRYVEQGEILLRNRDALDREFFAEVETSVTNSTQFNPQQNLQVQGIYSWNKSTFTYQNPRRPQTGYFDLYQPKLDKAVPLVVISHGLASNRQTFAYLGKHFASHGLAVAVVEHADISLNKFDNFLSGSARFPEPNNLIDQPLDITYVLNKLEQESKINPQLENKINFERIGVIGQSFGGYTSLALAGGELIADRLARECQPESHQDVLLDLSSLARCTYNELEDRQDQLKDPRIKAAIAINPLGKMFGKAGISSIEIPTMLVAGTYDLITPPVAEQIKPFIWLDTDLDKYLVLVKPGTHFSFLQEGLGVLPVPDDFVGPSPTSAYPALKALSTAFFQVHLAGQTEYQSYLQKERASLLNNNTFKYTLLRSLTQTELQKIINNY